MDRILMIRPCPNCKADNRIPARHLTHAGRCGACKESLSPLAIPMDVDQSGFDDVLANAIAPILVDFWAPWCSPCRTAAPFVAQAAEQLSGRAIVLKVNTEDQPGLGARFAIRSIPTFAVFNDGAIAWQQSGVLRGQDLVAAVERFL